MNIVKLNQQTELRLEHAGGANVVFCPGVRYVVTPMMMNVLEGAVGEEALERCGTFPDLRMRTGSLEGKRVLFYSDPIGLGDQLIGTAFPRYFREVLKAFPFKMAYEFNREVWNNNPYVSGSIIPPPIPLEALDGYGNHEPFFSEAYFYFDC